MSSTYQVVNGEKISLSSRDYSRSSPSMSNSRLGMLNYKWKSIKTVLVQNPVFIFLWATINSSQSSPQFGELEFAIENRLFENLFRFIWYCYRWSDSNSLTGAPLLNLLLLLLVFINNFQSQVTLFTIFSHYCFSLFCNAAPFLVGNPFL